MKHFSSINSVLGFLPDIANPSSVFLLRLLTWMEQWSSYLREDPVPGNEAKTRGNWGGGEGQTDRERG